jgi:hypothetical protein
MGNMAYCRFENTVGDLQDCFDHMTSDGDRSPSEEMARARLIRLCVDIALDFGDEIGRTVEESR